MRMNGNTVLVTGATSGIGRGLAEALHDRGNRVIITGRKQEALDEVISARPGMASLMMELDDPTSLKAVATDVTDRFPELNVVIANAGISGRENLAGDWDEAFAESLVQIKVIGVLRTVSAFLPHLRERNDATLIVTSSKLAFVPSAAFPTYCATKAFVHSWLQSLRHQLRGVSMEVLELLPPYVATKLTGPHQLDDPRAMPLDMFIAETMGLLEAGDHPFGELLVERARSDRSAEREGRYALAFATSNPA